MERFSTIAKWISDKAAQSYTGFAAFLIVLVWAIAGLPLHFSVIWHLIISTLSAVISIMMLFIIQNSQNRHTIAIQLKLDEIIRATKGAHNEMMDIEKLADEDMGRIQARNMKAGSSGAWKNWEWMKNAGAKKMRVGADTTTAL